MIDQQDDAQVLDGPLSSAELRSRTLTGLRSTVLARPLAEIVLLGAMIVLARLVSPSDYGRFGIATLVTAIAFVPLAGLGVALVQYPSVTRKHVQTSVALALILALALMALTFVAAAAVVDPVFGARTASFTRVASLSLLIMALNVVPGALLQRGLAIRRLSILDVSNAVAGSATAIALAKLGMGGYALIAGVLAAAFTTTTVNWVWAPQPFPRLYSKPARDLLRFGLPQTATMIAWVGFANIDYGIVGARLGTRQAGLYMRAYMIGVLYQNKVSQVLTNIGFPMLSRANSGEEVAVLRRQMVLLITTLIFPALVLLTIVAPVLIPWLFGPKWTPSVTPTQIMAIGGASTLAINAVGAVLMAEARSRALLAFGWGHFACYALVVLIGCHWGIVGVSVAVALDHGVFLLVSYVLLLGRSGQPLRALWEDIGPATTSSLILAVVALPISFGLSFVRDEPVLYLLLLCPLPVAAYALTLRQWFPRSWQIICLFGSHVLPNRLLRGVPARRMSGPIQEAQSVATGGEV